MKTKEKDWRRLDSYIGMSEEDIRETILGCGHMLTFGKDEWAIQVFRTFQDTPEAGMAALVSALFINKHGAAKTATTGVKLYQEIVKEVNKPGLAERVHNLEHMVYFADHSGTMRKLEWPLQYKSKDPGDKAGLANIMLWMAMTKLGDKEGSTSEQVAAFGIQRFFADSKLNKDSRVKA